MLEKGGSEAWTPLGGGESWETQHFQALGVILSVGENALLEIVFLWRTTFLKRGLISQNRFVRRQPFDVVGNKFTPAPFGINAEFFNRQKYL